PRGDPTRRARAARRRPADRAGGVCCGAAAAPSGWALIANGYLLSPLQQAPPQAVANGYREGRALPVLLRRRRCRASRQKAAPGGRQWPPFSSPEEVGIARGGRAGRAA